jgi:hypothetical protein
MKSITVTCIERETIVPAALGRLPSGVMPMAIDRTRKNRADKPEPPARENFAA